MNMICLNWGYKKNNAQSFVVECETILTQFLLLWQTHTKSSENLLQDGTV